MTSEDMELLKYEFIQNAILAAILVSIACGIIGTYVVINRIVFISGGIAHIAFGGLGVAYYFGFNPLIGAASISILSAFGLGWMNYTGKEKEDSIIGIPGCVVARQRFQPMLYKPNYAMIML
jgi:zinc transport system permease protein